MPLTTLPMALLVPTDTSSPADTPPCRPPCCIDRMQCGQNLPLPSHHLRLRGRPLLPAPRDIAGSTGYITHGAGAEHRISAVPIFMFYYRSCRAAPVSAEVGSIRGEFRYRYFSLVMDLPLDFARTDSQESCRRRACLVYGSVVIQMLFAIGCRTQTTGQEHARLQALISQEWGHRLRTYPEFATAIGDNRYNDQLTNYSAPAIAAEAEYNRNILQSFKNLNPTGLSKEDQLDRILMVRTIQTRVEDNGLKNWEMPVDQMNGPGLEYASLPEDMPFKTAHDCDNYLSRLRSLPGLFAEVTENMRSGTRDHLMPPRYLSEKVAAESADAADKPVDESPFTEPLKHLPTNFPHQRKSGSQRPFDKVSANGFCLHMPNLPALSRTSTRRKDEPNLASARFRTARHDSGRRSTT